MRSFTEGIKHISFRSVTNNFKPGRDQYYRLEVEIEN